MKLNRHLFANLCPIISRENVLSLQGGVVWLAFFILTMNFPHLYKMQGRSCP
ncbi:hypothetical protein XBI1_2590007 [Xenorhabdus bovienii str. Intermedium]|uniref:Uncharacterized protein n=1 Tax=Xenorhabdus bovienii str. Intermedium TaxID=1379677 RepID=A0A077QJC5_XENBV|nr:hypothetical protein XBI1_2590007 [Xenorhabdus bovienii str. Intermedium]